MGVIWVAPAPTNAPHSGRLLPVTNTHWLFLHISQCLASLISAEATQTLWMKARFLQVFYQMLCFNKPKQVAAMVKVIVCVRSVWQQCGGLGVITSPLWNVSWYEEAIFLEELRKSSRQLRANKTSASKWVKEFQATHPNYWVMEGVWWTWDFLWICTLSSDTVQSPLIRKIHIHCSKGTPLIIYPLYFNKRCE